jgi:hypothetical protein
MRSVLTTAATALGLWLVVSAASPRAARAEGGPFGLGLILGSPTGVSMKYYLGESGQAIDAAIGGAFSKSGLHVHVDYLWHPFMLVQEAAFNLPLHAGVGVRLLDHDRGKDGDDDLHAGLRLPVGLTFDFKEVPLDVFLEVALILDFHGEHGIDDDQLGLDINAGVGVRYYF